MSEVNDLIVTLKENNDNGKDTSAECAALAKKIDEVCLIDDFYQIDNDSLIKVLQNAGPLSIQTGKNVVSKLVEVFNSYSLYYLPFIEFGEIGEKIVDVINPLIDIPVFREFNRALSESKSEPDEVGISVDWKSEAEHRDKENLRLKSQLEQTKNQKKVNNEIIKKLMEANRVQPISIEDAIKKFVEKSKQKDVKKAISKGIKAGAGDPLFTALGKAIEAREPEAVKAITAHCKFDDFKAAFSLVRPKQGPKLLDEKLAICCCIMCSEIGADYKDREGNTPLHLVCRIDNVAAVEIFIALGANMDAKNYANNTPLHVAIRSGSSEAVRALMLHGATLDSDGELGKQLLHMAARGGNSEVLRKILDDGKWNVNAKDALGKTPLHYAAESGSALAVRTLLSKGADPHAKDFYGCEPILYAARADTEDSIAALLSAGASPNTSDPNGTTALHYAAMGKGVQAIPLLASKGAILDARDRYEDTPLHEACYHDQTEAIKALLKAGASVDWEGNGGKLPIHEAAFWGNAKSVLILVQMKADVNAKTKDGNTALHFAAKRGEDKAVTALIAAGAKVVKNSSGETAADVAKTPGLKALLMAKVK